jgi:NAD(P)-dependent dehydrogenase (short-subunit alcohol dehydrogenase family)
VAAAGIAWAAARRRRREYWDLAGRVVLITGGSRGLGLALARRLLLEGARVAICGRDPETLERARADLERSGHPVLALPCDVTVRASVAGAVDAVTRRLGPIDVLINNAGTITVGPVDAMRLEDFEDALAVNFWGALHAILAVVPDMRRRRSGRIVNVASIGGKIPIPHLLPYTASKFALVGLSEGLRAELARDGIRVTTVCPGLMRTGSPRHAWFKGRHRREYAWFSISDSLPGLSMDPDRAAAEIVEAARRGEAERVLSAPARIGSKAHALFPGLSAGVLAAVNAWMPRATGASVEVPVKGEASGSMWSPSWLTRLGGLAEERYNQLGATGRRE